MNAGGAAGTIFPPVGFWDKGLAADGAPLHAVPAENLRFQRLILRQDRPAKPLAADGIGNALGAGVGIPIVLLQTVAVVIAATFPADKGVCPFPLRRGHAVESAVRLALDGRQSFIWVLSHVFPPFFLSRSSRKGFLPHSCGVFQHWHAPRTSGHFVPKWLVAVLLLLGYFFSDGHSFFKVQLIDELP